MIKQLVLIGTLIVSAQTYANQTSDMLENNRKILASLGLSDPYTMEKIKIVPRKELNLPKSVIKKQKEEEQHFNKLGYIEDKLPVAENLLKLKSKAEDDLNRQKPLTPESTHLRRSLDEIKLAFNFKGMNAIAKSHVIGISPYLSYTTSGWSGATVFFEKDDGSMCSLIENGVKASHAGIEIAEEAVKYTINDKPTLIEIRGNAQTGFLYDLRWFVPETFFELQCANMKFSQGIMDDMIALAKEIDKL